MTEYDDIYPEKALNAQVPLTVVYACDWCKDAHIQSSHDVDLRCCKSHAHGCQQQCLRAPIEAAECAKH